MNVNTGELRFLKENEEPNSEEVLIEERFLTDKQKEEKRVSIKDHTSKAGKILTNERSNRGITKNKYKKLKRKGVLK